LAQRAYVQYHPAAPASQRPSPAEFRKHYLSEMHDRLKLDDAQMAKLTKIVADLEEEVRQIQAKRRSEDQESPLGAKRRAEDQAIQKGLVAKIDEVLRPDQRVLYQQLRDQRERTRKLREQQEQREGHGGPPGGPPRPPPPHGNP
jgi:murein L,D-transpeptidase YcbB/YkuD